MLRHCFCGQQGALIEGWAYTGGKHHPEIGGWVRARLHPLEAWQRKLRQRLVHSSTKPHTSTDLLKMGNGRLCVVLVGFLWFPEELADCCEELVGTQHWDKVRFASQSTPQSFSLPHLSSASMSPFIKPRSVWHYTTALCRPPQHPHFTPHLWQAVSGQ